MVDLFFIVGVISIIYYIWDFFTPILSCAACCIGIAMKCFNRCDQDSNKHPRIVLRVVIK